MAQKKKRCKKVSGVTKLTWRGFLGSVRTWRQRHRFLIFTGRNEVVAKVIFLHLFVILFTGGSASVHAGIPPPRSRHPKEQTPPQSRPPGPDPPEQTPPREADSSIRSTSGRYASYWNAFLFQYNFYVDRIGLNSYLCNHSHKCERTLKPLLYFMAIVSTKG